jgi:hypothetical protein
MLSILTSAVGLATSYIDGKAKVKSAEAETKMRIATGEISWEQSAIEASNNSWKDELWTVVFVLILVGNFIPGFQDIMAEGFANLQTTPPGCRLECTHP